MIEREAIVRVVLGTRGGGKSYLVKHVLMKDLPRLVIYDTQAEYTDGVIFYDKAEFIRFWLDNYRKRWRLIYRPLDPLGEIGEICRLVYLCGNCTFIAEECHLYADSRKCIEPNFQTLLRRGRHKNIDVIAVTQRPNGTHKDLLGQAKEAYIFKILEPRDRDYIREWMGSSIDSYIDRLEQYQFCFWSSDYEQGTFTIGKAGV